jgi:aspartate aminotransferase
MSPDDTTPPVAIHPNVAGLSVSPTLLINERSAALRAEGRDVFGLGFGQSPFPVPAPVVQALRDHAAETAYLPVRGLRELREAVADYHARRLGLDCSEADVIIGPGSKELIFLLQLVHHGELLLPNPSWVSYAPQATIVGRNVQWVETRAEDGWKLEPDALDAVCVEDSTLPKILILNQPNNPTGVAYDDRELAALADVARRRGLIVLADEIYGELTFDGAYRSFAQHYPEGTVVSAGLSKWCGAGGWRLGTFVIPKNLRWLMDAMKSAASETFSAVNAPTQYAAVKAFEGGDWLQDYFGATRAILSTLGHHVAAELRDAGATVVDPNGGFYIFPDFSDFQDRFDAESSVEFAELVLNETGVAFLPGTAFGRPHTEWTARIAYVNFDGEEVLERARELRADGREITVDSLRDVVPRTLEATRRLVEFLAGS